MCKELCLYLLILLQCCSAGPEVRVAGVAIIRTAVCITPALQRCILELETNLREAGCFTNTEKCPTWAFSWWKAATSSFTFKTLFMTYDIMLKEL